MRLWNQPKSFLAGTARQSLPRLAYLPRLACPALQSQRRLQCSAALLELPEKFTKVTPKGDLVLCKVAEAEQATTGGVLLPTSAQKRPTSGPPSQAGAQRIECSATERATVLSERVSRLGDVVAVGDGKVDGQVQDFHIKVGETVLYSKFGIGVTDLLVGGAEHCLIREDDCIGVLPRSGATASDIPELKPNGDRVLLKVFDAASHTEGGIFLPDAAKEKPIAGQVVSVGPGKRDKDGSRKAPKISAGDTVLYFKWAGDSMETPDGQKYVVVHENDILCRV